MMPPNSPTSDAPTSDTITTDSALAAILHQLEVGEASRGNVRDVAWCAKALRAHIESLVAPSPVPERKPPEMWQVVCVRPEDSERVVLSTDDECVADCLLEGLQKHMGPWCVASPEHYFKRPLYAHPSDSRETLERAAQVCEALGAERRAEAVEFSNRDNHELYALLVKEARTADECARRIRALPASEVRTAQREAPEIIVLCGSSRFIAETAVLAWELEKDGKIVLAMHLLPAWYTKEADHQAEAEGIAAQMDALHLRKIDMADRVMVVNPGGYYGESTRREIAYARAHGKPVHFTDGESPALSVPEQSPTPSEEKAT